MGKAIIGALLLLQLGSAAHAVTIVREKVPVASYVLELNQFGFVIANSSATVNLVSPTFPETIQESGKTRTFDLTKSKFIGIQVNYKQFNVNINLGTDQPPKFVDVSVSNIFEIGDIFQHMQQRNSYSFMKLLDMAPLFSHGTTHVQKVSEISVTSMEGVFDGAYVPEPGTWLMMIAGFAITGLVQRRRPFRVAC